MTLCMHEKNIYFLLTFLIILNYFFTVAVTDSEEPFPSLSDYHDYEPNLEFDDTELQSPAADIGKFKIVFIFTLDFRSVV